MIHRRFDVSLNPAADREDGNSPYVARERMMARYAAGKPASTPPARTDEDDDGPVAARARLMARYQSR